MNSLVSAHTAAAGGNQERGKEGGREEGRRGPIFQPDVDSIDICSTRHENLEGRQAAFQGKTTNVRAHLPTLNNSYGMACTDYKIARVCLCVWGLKSVDKECEERLIK